MRLSSARIALSLIVLSAALSASAIIPREIVESHVRSLEEFIERFNGEEIYPLVLDADTNKIRTTRLSLFNRDLLTIESTRDSMLSAGAAFIDSVEASGVKISMADPGCWVEAHCDFIYDDRKIKLTLKMTMEEFQPEYWRWAISDVVDVDDGLRGKDPRPLPIAPTEHEFDFSHLDDYFSTLRKSISRTASARRQIDLLSYFFGIASAGGIKYEQCHRVVFHCAQIPGWTFTAEQIHRIEESNSGWLINTFDKVSPDKSTDQ